jgi:hypothetical protein
MGQLERADDLAMLAFWYVGEHLLGPQVPSDEEATYLRTAAFRLSREVHAGSEPLLLKARDIAYAVLEWLSPFWTAGSFAKLRQASRAYEQARLRQ